jgi:DNA polymerase-3 subunit alpha
MFGDDDAITTVETIAIPDLPDYPRDQLLGFERDLLGLYLSDHPLQAFMAAFEKKNALRVSDLPEVADRADILLGGIITSIKPFTSKKSGEPMAFFTLEDMTGTVACTMFPSAYAAQGRYLEKDKIVLLKGKASHRERVRDDDEGGHIVEVLAEEIVPLANGGSNANAGPSKIVIRIDPNKREVLRYVRETVEQHRGNGSACPVHVRVPDGGSMHEVKTELLAEYNDAFRTALERLLGKQSVWAE